MQPAKLTGRYGTVGGARSVSFAPSSDTIMYVISSPAA